MHASPGRSSVSIAHPWVCRSTGQVPLHASECSWALCSQRCHGDTGSEPRLRRLSPVTLPSSLLPALPPYQVVVGDENGTVGVGCASAGEVSLARAGWLGGLGASPGTAPWWRRSPTIRARCQHTAGAVPLNRILIPTMCNPCCRPLTRPWRPPTRTPTPLVASRRSSRRCARPWWTPSATW